MALRVSAGSSPACRALGARAAHARRRPRRRRRAARRRDTGVFAAGSLTHKLLVHHHRQLLLRRGVGARRGRHAPARPSAASTACSRPCSPALVIGLFGGLADVIALARSQIPFQWGVVFAQVLISVSIGVSAGVVIGSILAFRINRRPSLADDCHPTLGAAGAGTLTPHPALAAVRARRPALAPQTLVVLIAAVAGARLGLRPISDNSTLVHLRTGLELVAHWSRAAERPVLVHRAGPRWVVQSWFASLLYGAAYRLGGHVLSRAGRAHGRDGGRRGARRARSTTAWRSAVAATIAIAASAPGLVAEPADVRAAVPRARRARDRAATSTRRGSCRSHGCGSTPTARTRSAWPGSARAR